jgi:hypothetical protein
MGGEQPRPGEQCMQREKSAIGMADQRAPAVVDRRRGGDSRQDFVHDDAQEAVRPAGNRQQVALPALDVEGPLAGIADAQHDGGPDAGHLAPACLQARGGQGRREQRIAVHQDEQREAAGRRRRSRDAHEQAVDLPVACGEVPLDRPSEDDRPVRIPAVAHAAPFAHQR